jgi:hypothetical protein
MSIKNRPSFASALVNACNWCMAICWNNYKVLQIYAGWQSASLHTRYSFLDYMSICKAHFLKLLNFPACMKLLFGHVQYIIWVPACCIAELYKQVWLRLNTVLPRCLWVMSINALLYESSAVKNVFLTQENIVLDPLQVLRCDTRVFRLVCFFLLE